MIPSRRIHRFIDVQLHHVELACIVVRDLRDRRREHVAWATPFRPKIYHYRLGIAGRQHFGLKIPVICCLNRLNRIISHILCPQWLASRLRASHLISPQSDLLDVPAGFWFPAGCAGPEAPCPAACRLCFAPRPACCPAPGGTSSVTGAGCPGPSPAFPQLCVSRHNPPVSHAASYSFAYSAAGFFHQTSFAIPFNWMRFQIRSSM